MTTKDKTYELILKSLIDEISEEEKDLLDKEISKDGSLKTSFIGLLSFWRNFFPKHKQHNIIELTEKKLGFTYHKSSGTKSWKWLKVAVSLLLIASLSFSTYHIFKPKQQLTLNEYQCSPGEVKDFTLSDGTKVWLNSSSLLIASEPFIGDKREVKLFGEAYFEVAHNEALPFEVKTRNLTTQVLGTHFNVVAYPTDQVHEISLYEGKVQIQAKPQSNKNYILNPGDRAYFTISTGDLKVIRTDLGKEAQWRDGILRFYNEDLFSISKKLERKFQSRIFIADSLCGNLRFSAEFEEESLEKIMKILSEAQAFRYEFTNNGVLIKSKKKT